MAEREQERRALAERYRVVHATENALTPQQARLFVRSIQNGWGVTPLDWSHRQSVQLFGQARRLVHAASIFEETDGLGSDAATGCYRRAGEIFEWLARSRDAVTRDVPTEALAAGAYQLAGLPAMATGLLKRTKPQGAGAVLGAFLACDFDSALRHAETFWSRHEDLTGRDGSARLIQEAAGDAEPSEPIKMQEEGPSAGGAGESPDEDAEPEPEDGGLGPDERSASNGRVAWYIVVETVRALGLAAEGIRRGEEGRTGLALEKLAALSELATRWAGDEAWITLRLVRATAERFARDSLHRRGAPLVAGSPAAAARLQRFAREQFARGRGVLWASQVSGLDRLIKGNAFALCTPTGSGKTLVANLALLKELLLADPVAGGQARLALYLVPSRALAGEVEAKLSAEFRAESVLVTGLYGGTDWGITDNWLTADTPTVLIATVEKAEALMRYVGHLLMHRLELLIIDEAHQVVGAGDHNYKTELGAHSDRAMRLESLVSRLLALKPDMARIALTAVAGGAAAPVARWIEGDADATPVGLGYRSSRQLVGVLECRPKQAPRITLELNNGQPLYVRGREDPVFLALDLPPMPDPPAGVKNSLHHYVQIYAFWTALNLTAGGRRILISITQGPDRVMRRYAEAFQLNGWDQLAAFRPEAGAHQRLFDEARAACVDYCGADSSEVQLLDRGVATSHGQMPQRLRRLMVALIDQRVCPITVATATLTEGVNLPFDLIILPSLDRATDWLPSGAPVNDIISTAEFRNLAGRAGRPGAAESMEGMTLVCLPITNAATAASKQQEQRNQRDAYGRSLDKLLEALAKEEAPGVMVNAPLQTLLKSIWQKLLAEGFTSEVDFHAFLEASLPESVGTELGVGSRQPLDMLGDSLDELDAFLLAALDEVERLVPSSAADLEQALRTIWARTFTRYASVVEDWMERAFIKRGRAVVEQLYPDPATRRTLYQIGFTPYVGRQFQQISPAILAQLRDAAHYGRQTAEQRFNLFWQVGELVREGRGFGFTSRNATEYGLIGRWHEVAGWWLQRPGAPAPLSTDLRRWQGFVANNLEYRLGVAAGAAMAEAWNANAAPLAVPSLEAWRSTTDLPWIGFWFRELIRWGTMDPFVAFALAQGLVGTREEGQALRGEFDIWLLSRGKPIADEDLIDPQLFMDWNRSRPQPQPAAALSWTVAAVLNDVEGTRNSYPVRPIPTDGGVIWIDPAGFKVALSDTIPASPQHPERHDFMVANELFGVRVTRTF
jgi:hypothetical protein